VLYPQNSDRIVTIDSCDVTSSYVHVYCILKKYIFAFQMASRGNRHCASCIPMPETFSVLELSCISWAVLYRIVSASRVKNDFFIQSWFTASSAACVPSLRFADLAATTRTPDIVGVQRRVVSVVVFDGRYLSGRGRRGPSELPANIPSHCSDKNKRARNKTILIN